MVTTLILFFCSIQLLFIHAQISKITLECSGKSLHMNWITRSGEKGIFKTEPKRRSIVITTKNRKGPPAVLRYIYKVSEKKTEKNRIYWILKKTEKNDIFYCLQMEATINEALADDYVTKIQFGTHMVKPSGIIPKPKPSGIKHKPSRIKPKPKPETVVPTPKTISISEVRDGVLFRIRGGLSPTPETIFINGDSEPKTVTIDTTTFTFVRTRSDAIEWDSGSAAGGPPYTTIQLQNRINDHLREPESGHKVTIKIGRHTIQHGEAAKGASESRALRTRAKPPPPIVRKTSTSKSKSRGRVKAPPPRKEGRRGKIGRKTVEKCKPFATSNLLELNYACETQCKEFFGSYPIKKECEKVGREFSEEIDCSVAKTSAKRKLAICKAAKRESPGGPDPEEKPCSPDAGDDLNDCVTECISILTDTDAARFISPGVKEKLCTERYDRPENRYAVCLRFVNAVDPDADKRDVGYYWECEANIFCAANGGHNVQCDQKKGGDVATDGEIKKKCRQDLTRENKDIVKCSDFKYKHKSKGKAKRYDRIFYQNNDKVCAQGVGRFDHSTGKYGWLGDYYFIMCSAPVEFLPKKEQKMVLLSPNNRFDNYIYKPFDGILVIVVFILFLAFGMFCFFMGGGVTFIGFRCAPHVIFKNI